MVSPRFCYVFGAFRLDPVEKVLSHEAQPVALTPKAVDTLVALVERHGRLVSKDELLRLVWPDAYVEENNLAQNISTLRRVLGESGGERIIETVPKRGYRFVAEVTKEFVAAEPVDTETSPEPRSGHRVTVWSVAAAVAIALTIVADLCDSAAGHRTRESRQRRRLLFPPIRHGPR